MATLVEILKKLNKDKREEDKITILGNREIVRTATSTGSPYLDYMSGGGFLNAGYNTMIASGGVGKSSIALLAAKDTHERRGKMTVYFDGENTLSDSYFTRMGISKDNLLVIPGRNLEDMLDQAEAFAQADEIGTIIIDSIPIYVSTTVEGKTAAENTIGIEAKRFTQRMPLIEGYAIKRDICIIGLTSYKLNPGAMGDPRVLQRGEWQKTMSNTTLDLTKKELLKDKAKNVIGHKIECRIKKSKNSAYDASEVVVVNFYNNGGFNQIDEYARLFVETEIAKAAGAWIKFPDSNGEEQTVQGMDKFIDYLKENKEDFDSLKNYLNNGK